MMSMLDLNAQDRRLRSQIRKAIHRVMESGQFILGENVRLFENEFSKYCGNKYCIGVGNGTDALYLALTASGVRQGDEVVTVSHTAIPTGSAIRLAGATPVFVDINPVTFTLDPEEARQAITKKTKAILPVNIYGHPCDLNPIYEIAEKHGIQVIEDCAQAHGTEYNGKRLPLRSGIGCYSFYPSKNLGAYGDAGAIVVRDAELAGRLAMLRNYGQGDRYHQKFHGINSRLDEVQAAVLRVKLRHLDSWNAKRRTAAKLYKSFLEDVVVPEEMPWAKHNYHLFVVRAKRRNALRSFLERKRIQTQVHYPIPLHLQVPWHSALKRSLHETEKACSEVLSLPLHPEITREQVSSVSKEIRAFFEGR